MSINEEINNYFVKLGGGRIDIASANKSWIYAEVESRLLEDIIRF